MEEQFKDSFKQAAAFQKMWMDSMSGVTRIWSDYSPKNPPPDEIKKVRNGVLNVISQTWEEYMRTPEFMEAMRDTINNTTRWQKMAKENANRVQTAMGSANKDDVQGVMVALQHVERRVLDGLDEMQKKVSSMQTDIENIQTDGTKNLEKYQAQILKQLAEIGKAMKAEKTASAPPASKPAPKPVSTKKVLPKKAPAKKPAVKKSAKKSAKKTAKPTISKAKQP